MDTKNSLVWFIIGIVTTFFQMNSGEIFWTLVAGSSWLFFFYFLTRPKSEDPRRLDKSETSSFVVERETSYIYNEKRRPSIKINDPDGTRIYQTIEIHDQEFTFIDTPPSSEEDHGFMTTMRFEGKDLIDIDRVIDKINRQINSLNPDLLLVLIEESYPGEHISKVNKIQMMLKSMTPAMVSEQENPTEIEIHLIPPNLSDDDVLHFVNCTEKWSCPFIRNSILFPQLL